MKYWHIWMVKYEANLTMWTSEILCYSVWYVFSGCNGLIIIKVWCCIILDTLTIGINSLLVFERSNHWKVRKGSGYIILRVLVQYTVVSQERSLAESLILCECLIIRQRLGLYRIGLSHNLMSIGVHDYIFAWCIKHYFICFVRIGKMLQEVLLSDF